MKLLSFFARRGSAPVARERLQILLAHERALSGGSGDLVAMLQEEILAVIAQACAVERDKVQIKLERGDVDVDAGDRHRDAGGGCRRALRAGRRPCPCLRRA